MKKMVLVPFDQYTHHKMNSTIAGESVKGLNNAEENKSSGEKIEDKTRDTVTINEDSRMPEDLLIFPIASKNKRKAEALLKYIDKNMDWNEKGEVIIEGEVQTGSHLTDLLKDALSGADGFKPIAADIFYSALHHTPISLFHPKRRNIIGKGGGGEVQDIGETEKEKESHFKQRLSLKDPRLPPPGIPIDRVPIDLMDPSIWTNKWRKI